MLTADTITDAQIRELHALVKPRGVADIFCRIALGIPLPTQTNHGDALNWDFDPNSPAEREKARAYCARLLSARATLTRCPGCNAPTHASESDDDGRCVACMRAAAAEPITEGA